MRVNEANKNKNLFTPKESRSSTTLGIPSSPPPQLSSTCFMYGREHTRDRWEIDTSFPFSNCP